MLIHFAVCGIGLGHVTRSVEVAKELSLRGHRIFFSTYDQAYSYLVKHGLPTAKVLKVGYGVGEDGTISVKKTILNNVWLPVLFSAQTLAESKLINDVDADVVVSDTRASATLAGKLLRKPVATIINQYNLRLVTNKYRRFASLVERTIQAPQKIWDLSDVIIVPDLPPPFTISESTLQFSKKAAEKAVYTGPLIRPVNREESKIREIREELGASGKPLVLISVSGGHSEKKTLVEKILMIAETFDDEYVYVLSAADVSSNVVRKVGPLIYMSWVPDLDAYIKAADAVVFRGGLTLLSKCLLYGRKMLIIPTPLHGEQLSNAAKAEKLGVAKILHQHEISAEKFRKDVSQVLNDEEMVGNLSHLRSVLERCGGVEAAAATVESLY
ncbi:MAG: glycosyltransferase family protein [Candidatus Caldarchaeum sp.]